MLVSSRSWKIRGLSPAFPKSKKNSRAEIQGKRGLSFRATPDLVRGCATRNPEFVGVWHTPVLDAGFHRHDEGELRPIDEMSHHFGTAALRRPMAASARGLMARSTATLSNAGFPQFKARCNAGARSSGRSTNSP